jgi:probable HAF family extracellular repeat protein
MDFFKSITAIALLSVTGSASAATNYAITDLGTLFGGSDQAYGINADGLVAGISGSRAVLYGGGTVTNLGTLPGGTTSVGLGINNAGQVIGYSNTSGATRGFIYTGGVMTSLGSLTGGSSFAYGINDSSQVVGGSVAANGSLHAVLYGAGGAPTDIGTLGGVESFARAINNSGQITGSSTISPSGGSSTHAFLYSGGVMTDLGTLFGGAGNSIGYDINASGQVVGRSGNAFLYGGGVMTDLGILSGGTGGSSAAYGINDSGQVVGASYLTGLAPDPFHPQPIAFMYENGVMSNLNSLITPGSGWFLQEARDINVNGQIVGWGVIGGQTHAFLLTPVPEPESYVLFLAGLILIRTVVFARRKPSGVLGLKNCG